MDNRLIRLEEKQDALLDKLQTIAVSTAENTASLKEHMAQTIEVRKQTDILKQMYAELHEATFKALNAQRDEFKKELAPVHTFVDRFKFTLTILAYSGSAMLLAEKIGMFDAIVNLIRMKH